MVDLSVIIPFYNEDQNLTRLNKEVVNALRDLKIRSEIIYVDDGSTDKSALLISKEVSPKKIISIKLIRLRRNFGQTAATMAGIDASKGKILAFLDSDLQNDPNDIPKLLSILKGETEAVVGWRKKRKDSFLHNTGTWFINLLTRKFLKVPLHDTGCSLKVIKKSALGQMRLYGEFHRLIPIILYWRGVKMREVVVNHRPRKAGKSKYNYFKIIRFFLDLLTIKFLDSYGSRPAYIFGALGLTSCMLATLPMIITLYEKIFYGIYVHRNPLFMISIFLFLIGVQFIFFGFIGEFLVRIYYESQNKTIYELKK